MIRVAHVTTSLDTGGAQMMLYKLLASMDRSRFECSVISLMDKGLLGPQLERLGIAVYPLGMPLGRPTLAALTRLVRALRAVRPALVQGWMYHGNLAASIARRTVPGAPRVLWNIRQTLYGLEHEKPLSQLVIRAGGRLSKSVSRILYNSAVSAAQHEALGYAHTQRVLIPNGFETDRFRPMADARARVRAELGIAQDSLVVGIIGRFHPMKDQESFVRAAIRLHEHRPGVEFVLAGPGLDEDNPQLVPLARASGAWKNFHFLGQRTDMPELMNALDVFALCSAWGEAFPNVLGEAMSSGLVCVATDVGDSSWILGDCGIVVPPHDTEKLAEAVGRVLDMTPEERHHLGRCARERVLSNFSLAGVTSRYEALYQDVVAEQRRSA